MRKIITLMILIATFAMESKAQILTPVKWNVTCKKVSEGVYDIISTATIDAGWHMYDVKLPEGGPLSTSFNLYKDETSGVTLIGEFKATTKAEVEKSEAFDMDVRFFEKTVIFIQRIKVKDDKGVISGYIEFMACSGGQCIPPGEAEFEFKFPYTEPVAKKK